MDFNQNYFDIFGLPIDFNIDIDRLAESYRKLQQELHPDRFAAGTDQEKRVSVQWSSLVNMANETLRSPLSRAIYIAEQKGLTIDHNPQLPAQFLMRQIELREELESLEEDAAGMGKLDEFKERLKQALEVLGQEFADSNDDEVLLTLIYEMQFFSKLLVAADQLEEKLLDY